MQHTGQVLVHVTSSEQVGNAGRCMQRRRPTARQEVGKKLYYCESQQILKCISGETSRLLAQTLTVLNSDFVGSILKSVEFTRVSSVICRVTDRRLGTTAWRSSSSFPFRPRLQAAACSLQPAACSLQHTVYRLQAVGNFHFALNIV